MGDSLPFQKDALKYYPDVVGKVPRVIFVKGKKGLCKLMGSQNAFPLSVMSVFLSADCPQYSFRVPGLEPHVLCCDLVIYI